MKGREVKRERGSYTETDGTMKDVGGRKGE